MDYRSVSFWLGDAGDDLTPRPALDGSTDADVAILGAGLTGLWTAFYLRRRDPSLRIVIVEREIAGFGAIGPQRRLVRARTSTSRWAGWRGSTARTPPGAMQQATYDAVDEVGRATAEAGIDGGFHKGGAILVARGPQGVPALEARSRSTSGSGSAIAIALRRRGRARRAGPDRGGRRGAGHGRCGRHPPGPARPRPGAGASSGRASGSSRGPR